MPWPALRPLHAPRASAVAALAVAVWALLAAPSASAVPASAAVVELTDKDFDAAVGDGLENPWFVKFYAPWCGHCKAMAPIWEKLATRLEGSVKVAHVDATKSPWVADQYDVEGYPTLKLIAEGKVFTYNGKRDLEILMEWAKNGWRAATPELLPRDKPLHERALKMTFNVLFTYGLPVALLASVGFIGWMIWTSQPTEEDRKRRKAFEAKMAEYERRMADREKAQKAAGTSSEGSGAGETEQAQKEAPPDENKDAAQEPAGPKHAEEKKTD